MLESDFQILLKEEIKTMLPGSFVLKNDARLKQGFPDLVILYKNHWAVLEVKKSKKATNQPNQPYYVNLLNEMSFARFIYPENKEEVLHDLCRAFRVSR